MLEGINSNFQVQNVQNYKPKKIPVENNSITNPIDNYTMAGLESLGIYNMSLVKNKNNFEHEPAELILPPETKINDVEGEKVLDPYGKLDYIVKNDGKFETRYYPDSIASDKIYKIEIRDVYSGKLLKEQNDNIITEYPVDEPSVRYETMYNDNRKVHSVEKEEELPDGSIKRYEKYFYTQIPELSIDLHDKNHNNFIRVAFDSKNVVKSIGLGRKIGNNRYLKDICLNKGAVVNISENKETNIPNFMERDVLNDTDVIPTEKFDKEKIETLAKNSPSNIYSFNGDGSLKELKDNNIKIEFNEDGSQNITEYLDKNITKVTKYYKDNSIDVSYLNGDTEKYLEISSDNKPQYYDIRQGDKCIRSAKFSEEGYLEWMDS